MWIPNELLFALSRFQFTQRQYSVLLAVIQKTLSWHKETDWICNDQIAELANLYDSKLASKIKNELIEMNVLIQKGKQIGVNLAISEWENLDSTKDTKIVRNVRNKSDKSYDSNRTNHTTTKETITKHKINNTPLTPQGGEAEVKPDENILADAQSALAYYNELANGSCRDAKPFITLLTKTSSREAYSLDEIKIVVKWVLAVWKRRNGSPPKPKNICTVTRFDGYLSDALSWQKNQALYLDVVDAYNRILGDRLVPMNELDRMAEGQIQGLLANLKDPSIDGFTAYFETFAANAKPYYFEPEKKLGFSFLMKPETLYKTRRGEL